MTSYDDIPYDSHAFSGTHPDQLAVMAKLFGLSTRTVDNCRVLELGCASGGNIIPMAASLPESHFVGIDLSQRQIDDGTTLLESLELSNVQLQARDILDVAPDFGKFDYIICHGVYSWVPPEVQQHILSICRENLVVGGIAYVSYNTYPGWHLRGAVREMMQFHAARFEDAPSRIEQSRALLDFLISAVPQDGSAYSQLLNDELQIIQHRADNYLYHEHLEDYNEPLYFHQFAKRAEDAGMRFLSENYLSQMVPNQFTQEVNATLMDIANDITHMEQYMDFLRNRMFRCSLLCHAEVEPHRVVQRERLMDCHVGSPLAPENFGGSFSPSDGMVFVHPTESRVTIVQALQQAAIFTLGQIWPRRLPLDELAVRARKLLGDEPANDDRQRVADVVLECLSGDLVEIRLTAQRYRVSVSDTPAGCALARRMAEDGYWVTNRRHETLLLNSISRQTLLLLDGSRDHDAIAESLCSLVSTGDMTIQQAGKPLTEEAVVRETIEEALGQVLAELGSQALLVA